MTITNWKVLLKNKISKTLNENKISNYFDFAKSLDHSVRMNVNNMNLIISNFQSENLVKTSIDNKIYLCDEDCECEFCTAFNRLCYGQDYVEEDFEDLDSDTEEDVLAPEKEKPKELPCKFCKTKLLDNESICWKCGTVDPTVY